MSSAEYVPVARGALKLKGVSQASKSHRKKKPKPEPSLLAHKDTKEGDLEKREDDKIERHIRSRSRDQEDEERNDRRDKEREGGGVGGEQERERETDMDPKEQEEIPTSRGKTAAEVRHEERRKRKVCVPLPPCFALRFSFNFRIGRNRISLFTPFLPMRSYPSISSPSLDIL